MSAQITSFTFSYTSFPLLLCAVASVRLLTFPGCSYCSFASFFFFLFPLNSKSFYLPCILSLHFIMAAGRIALNMATDSRDPQLDVGDRCQVIVSLVARVCGHCLDPFGDILFLEISSVAQYTD